MYIKVIFKSNKIIHIFTLLATAKKFRQILGLLSRIQTLLKKKTFGSTDNAMYLGVNIDCKLSWNYLIETIVKKANNFLNFIHRNFKNCSPVINIKAKLYIA